MNEQSLPQTAPFFVCGGNLMPDAPSYVYRVADEQLYEALKRGEYCYVLTSRQMGKSSLMVRTALRLQDDGFYTVILSFTAFGQNLTVEQWYESLILTLGERLGLEEEIEEYWDEHQNVGPLRRAYDAIRRVVMPALDGPIVIFIDEIDVVQSLPFSTDEFFAAIRDAYLQRAEDPTYQRIVFCLFGVATPGDLIADPLTTPFNIGARIDLTDFTEDEAQRFVDGLPGDRAVARKLVNRAIYWTGGQPYLTQRLCEAISKDKSATTEQDVDRLCEQLFLTAGAKERESNLQFVRNQLLNRDVDIAALLTTYGDILRGKRIEHDETNPLHSVLRLSGVARVEEGTLRVRNRVYARVFDRAWIKENMPGAELRRQRAAFQRGLFQAAWTGAFVLVALCVLALVAIAGGRRSDRMATEAESQKNRVIDLLRAIAPPSSAFSIDQLVEGDVHARLQCVLWLSSTKPIAEEAISLLTYAVSDENAEVRAAAIHSLGQIGAPAMAATSTLLQAAKSEDPPSRAAAARALGFIWADSEPIEAQDRATALRALNVALSDEDPLVRDAAASALAGLGELQAGDDGDSE